MSDIDPRYTELLEAARAALLRSRDYGPGSIVYPKDAARLEKAVKAFEPKRRTFDGVVFEEVGLRPPEVGDWCLNPATERPYVHGSSFFNPAIRLILKPVSVEARDE